MLSRSQKFYITFIKRPIGFIGALTALVLLSPIFMATAVLLFFANRNGWKASVIYCATNSAEAYKYAMENRIDLFLIDIVLDKKVQNDVSSNKLNNCSFCISNVETFFTNSLLFSDTVSISFVLLSIVNCNSSFCCTSSVFFCSKSQYNCFPLDN